MPKKEITKNSENILDKADKKLLSEIRLLIEQTRTKVAQTINSSLVLMNWNIRKLINVEILKNKRAEYGKETVSSLSRQLREDCGNSFNRGNLFRMSQFAEVFPNKKIVASLTRQLSWTHFLALIPIKNQLKRDFYAKMCRIENWSTRILRDKMNGQLFERTAISKKPADYGQTEFYLRWLDKYEREAHEESPIGLILCSEKSNERVKLLALDENN